jgi:hypothetical protein
LGAQADLIADDVRWLSPLPLWTGILSGPVAWALDLCVGYALVKWSCTAGREDVLRGLTFAALGLVAAGAAVSWTALRRTRGDVPEDGGGPRQRARFMALLGLATSALFAIAIAAGAVPRWVLDGCH